MKVRDFVSRDAYIVEGTVALIRKWKRNGYLAVLLDEDIVDGYCNVYEMKGRQLKPYCLMKPFENMASRTRYYA